MVYLFDIDLLCIFNFIPSLYLHDTSAVVINVNVPITGQIEEF